MIDSNCGWDWNRISAALSGELVDRIAVVPPPRGDAGLDKPVWRWESNHKFTTRSAYLFLSHDVTPLNAGIWTRVWKIPVGISIGGRLHGDILARCIQLVKECKLAIAAVQRGELVNRIAAVPPPRGGAGSDKPVRRWESNHKFTTRSTYLFVSRDVTPLNAADMDWSTRFAIMCWLLWKRRCRLVLAPEEGYMGIFSQCHAIECWLVLASEEGYMGDILARCIQLVKECKLAIAAVQRVSPIDSKASVGGVFRDDQRRWLHGFARYIGRCDALFAELWAIHDCLIQAWESGFSQVVLESNCLEATRVVNSSSDALASSALVSSIKDLLTRDWRVVVRHVSRVRNRVADLLTARGRELGMNQSIFYNPPADFANVIEEELLVLHSNVSEAVGIG
ncbi:hypothetical protein V6N11_071569 [Hibiscus sabdariffa]|uniref:RNase H type-1 domain-containing protein n=1 Tax=Hibiscus sabdariffa TaxID=183260 RepID=A0ABR2U164_9ROSI